MFNPVRDNALNTLKMLQDIFDAHTKGETINIDILKPRRMGVSFDETILNKNKIANWYINNIAAQQNTHTKPESKSMPNPHMTDAEYKTAKLKEKEDSDITIEKLESNMYKTYYSALRPFILFSKQVNNFKSRK